MSRCLALAFCALIFVTGCSRNPEPPSTASPTPVAAAPAPGSLLGPTGVAPGGINGKFDASFPPRNESFDFRNQLETKYQTSLGRSAAATFVDREGEVVWTQEYMRYRVNGCDHNTAVQRVLAQINGEAAGQVCGAAQDGLIAFPPRTDSFDFRRQLESRYQQFNRGASSSTVDAEGGVVWTQEYLRYRTNACDHNTSVQKVFSQIDGGGIAPTCYVPPCIFTVSAPNQAVGTPQSVGNNGGSYTANVTKTSGNDCSFSAESLDSFITITGTTTSSVTYNVGTNFGSARTGYIRIRWTNNSTLMQIDQAGGSSTGFTLTDPNTSSSTTTTCLIKTTSTPCKLTSTGSYSSNATYTWHVAYQYGVGAASHDYTSTDPTFTFTQTCGGSGATAAGNPASLDVTLTIQDGSSSVTIQSGAGAQPALTIKFFTC